MHKKIKHLLLSAMIVLPMSVPVFADTVSTTTTTQQATPMPGEKIINLAGFDLNKDSLLSTFEVGEMLFKYYDMNTDNFLDRTEYERKAIVTVVPMEKEITINYDYNNDGVADKTQYTHQRFMQDTQLARFDTNKDGLSPHDFINKDFLAVDTNSSGTVDVTEWRTAYVSATPQMTN